MRNDHLHLAPSNQLDVLHVIDIAELDHNVTAELIPTREHRQQDPEVLGVRDVRSEDTLPSSHVVVAGKDDDALRTCEGNHDGREEMTILGDY